MPSETAPGSTTLGIRQQEDLNPLYLLKPWRAKVMACTSLAPADFSAAAAAFRVEPVVTISSIKIITLPFIKAPLTGLKNLVEAVDLWSFVAPIWSNELDLISRDL